MTTPYETHGPLGAAADLIIRVARGATHRFPLRVSDWFASFVLVSFGVVLFNWPAVFKTDPFFALLDQIGSPILWGVCCFAIGSGRLLALTVNGTFPAFRWSPHLRFVMALFSVFIWTQVSLGLLVAHVPTTAFAVFPQLLVFDLYNVFLAATEAGMVERQHRYVGS